MENEIMYYVARERQSGFIVTIISDSSILCNFDKAKMVKRCIAEGFQVDRMNQKEISELLATQKEPPDYPKEQYDGDDNELPF